jgi:hypothetical protein
VTAFSRNLDAIAATPKSGNERFTVGSAELPATLLQFWRWSCSDLLGNAMRGVLAEYIVGLALDCVSGQGRMEWDAADLLTASGVRVEVKSAAYLQSWRQERLSPIRFGIQPTVGWDAQTNTVAAERKRQADVYVFSVFKHIDQATADPLKLEQWDFYVMSTAQLNTAVGDQKTISLASLLRHKPVTCSFSGIRKAVDTVLRG